MTFGAALDALFLKPIQLIIEIIYSLAYRLVLNPGLAIIALSLAVNFLVLPLYRRADAMQEEERQTEERLRKWVTHIKKAFRGDERTMMLQTYYRQNHYSPLYVLRGATSLLLEIPFFIAAYRFLSGLYLLQGVSFGPIADLSKPDALLSIGGAAVNVLPFLMTGLNIVSAVLFTKGQPLRSKIQLYAMALFFLIFLYNSPAGLVFYWTLNNLFSLIKTVFYKLKRPRFVLSVLAALVSLPLFRYGAVLLRTRSKRAAFAVLFLAVCLWIPLLLGQLKKRGHLRRKPAGRAPDRKVFLLGCLFLAALTGLLIPSAVISSSPQEFMDVRFFVHPLWFVAHSFLTALGLFVFWFGVFYWLADAKTKPVFESAVWALCIVALVNYLCFGITLIITPELTFEKPLSFSPARLICNGLVDLAVFAAMIFVNRKWKKAAPRMLAISVTAIVCLSVYFGVGTVKSVKGVNRAETVAAQPGVTLSRNGKNVIVIMLDRAMGTFVPYMLNEKPELKEKLSGFTYYANTVSFGNMTKAGSPALYGGYEYTPVELNRRDGTSLAEKQNEALRVMPVLFSSNGFDVTVFDPTYAGYQWIPDLSVFDGYPDIRRYIVNSHFIGQDTVERQRDSLNRNFFLYGVSKISPLLLQTVLYDGGQYHQLIPEYDLGSQSVIDSHRSVGKSYSFMKAYSTLENLETLTHISDAGADTFFMMANDTPHEAMMLQEPEYVPETYVDNTAYDSDPSRFILDGRTLIVESDAQYAVYQSNMASLIQLGRWFDYLRSEGVYDNTRIILVSDHGYSYQMLEELFWDTGKGDKIDLAGYCPLLMVKDFDAAGFTVSQEFMTNADVPTLAAADIIEDPRNPATGKPISSSEKTAHKQYILSENPWQTDRNHGNTFFPTTWYSVHDSIWDTSNWEVAAVDAVMPTD